MFAQVDDEGHQFLLLDEIIDHKRDNLAIPILEGTIWKASGTEKPKRTTKGWKLLVQFKDGSLDWVNLKDIKDSNPVEVMEYAVANQLINEPAFKWWVPYIIRKRNHVVKKVKLRYWRMMHKFGIQLPHLVEEALRIDEETGTDFWRWALNKEMAKVKVPWAVKEGYTLE